MRVGSDHRFQLPDTWLSNQRVKGSVYLIGRGPMLVVAPGWTKQGATIYFKAKIDNRDRVHIPEWLWDALGWQERKDLQMETHGILLAVRQGP